MAARKDDSFDAELADLPMAQRWRIWMARAEAVIFAAPGPVTRDTLARIAGRDCSIDLLVEDVANELRDRPYELVAVAGGWQLRTRTRYADAIRAARGAADTEKPLTPTEALVLTGIGYLQPVTRTEMSRVIGREISRDTIGRLHRYGFLARGPRSPEPGAPYTYVTTPEFLIHFGLNTLRDLPDMEALEDAGLLHRDRLADAGFPIAGEGDGPEDE